MGKRKPIVGGIDKRYSLVDLLYYLLQILSTQDSAKLCLPKMPRVAKKVVTFTEDLVAFTEEIFNGKFCFLCSDGRTSKHKQH